MHNSQINPLNHSANDSKMLFVIFNDEAVLEFDRDIPIPEDQIGYLKNMDARMDKGIELGKDYIDEPNPLQKAQFVANSMVNGLIKQDFNLSIAMCTYLGKRLPDLKQVKCIKSKDDGISIEFVYDKKHQKSQTVQEQTIKFFDPKDFVKH